MLHTGAASRKFSLFGLRSYAKKAIMPFGHDRAELSDLKSKAIERQRMLEQAKIDKAKAAGYLATREELVKQANKYARVTLGLDYQPALEKKTIGKMGLKGVPGLRIA